VFDDEAVKVSRIEWPRARWENWALAPCHRPHGLSGGPMYDPGGDVGAGNTPSI
jgi:hypothetical protein